MKYVSAVMFAAGLGLGLVSSGLPASAQQPPAAQAPVKPSSPAAIAAAKEILTMKNVSTMYANAVPNVVQRAKDSILQNNLNYQKDLNEVAVAIVQLDAGREKEI